MDDQLSELERRARMGDELAASRLESLRARVNACPCAQFPPGPYQVKQALVSTTIDGMVIHSGPRRTIVGRIALVRAAPMAFAAEQIVEWCRDNGDRSGFRFETKTLNEHAWPVPDRLLLRALSIKLEHWLDRTEGGRKKLSLDELTSYDFAHELHHRLDRSLLTFADEKPRVFRIDQEQPIESGWFKPASYPIWIRKGSEELKQYLKAKKLETVCEQVWMVDELTLRDWGRVCGEW